MTYRSTRRPEPASLRIGPFDPQLPPHQLDLIQCVRASSFRRNFSIMPLEVLSEEIQTAAIAGMKSDLLYLFEERGIDNNVAAHIGRAGIRTVPIFSKIESKEEDFRDWLEEVGIKKSEGGRALQAMLVDAWDAARTRVADENEASAKARTEGKPKEMLKGAQLDLRRTYQKIAGELPDNKYPSYTYVNSRLSEIEEGELEAETLDCVTSYELEKGRGVPDFSMEWTRSGQARLKQERLKGSLPANTEELRATITLMRHHWGIVRMRHGSKPYLQGLDAEVWVNYIDFLLGEEAYRYSVKDDMGNTVASLSWHALLRYEQEMRNWAIRQVNLGNLTLAQALKQAQTDNELKTKYVVAALALSHLPASAHKRPYIPSDQNLFDNQGSTYDEPRADKKAKKGKGKKSNNGAAGGKAAGSSGSKGGKGDSSAALSRFNIAKKHKQVKQLEDGKSICWNYNRPSGCSNGSCSFVHVCFHCGGAHTLDQCRKFGDWMARNGKAVR